MDKRIKVHHGETRKITQMWNWPENPNKMNDIEGKALIESIKKFGIVEPLIIDEENMILGGNHRAGVLFDLMGADAEVPVVQITGLTKDEKGKLGLALNKIHGTNNAGKLKSLMDSFEDPADLLTLGFSEEDFKSLSLPIDAEWATPDNEELFEAPREIKKKPVKCPACGHEFVPEKEKGAIGRKKYKDTV